MEAVGVQVTNAGLEAPWQIGKVEREGGLWKDIARRVIHQKKISGPIEMKLMTTEVNTVRNDMARVAGFAPSQWAFGKLPRRGAGEQFDAEGWADFGAVQERVDDNQSLLRRPHIARRQKKLL